MYGLDSRTLLGVLFGTSIVVANITATKVASFTVPVVGRVILPAGFLGIAVAFLCSDLLSEIHGPAVAHRVVTATVASLGVAFVLVEATIAFPAAPFYESQQQYATVLGGSTTVVVAAICTTLVSQHLDVAVFHEIRTWTGTKWKFARNLGSTVVSQFVDTALFVTLAFVILPVVLGGTTTPIPAAVALIGGQYSLKLLVAVADTPLFYVGSSVHEYVTDHQSASTLS